MTSQLTSPLTLMLTPTVRFSGGTNKRLLFESGPLYSGLCPSFKELLMLTVERYMYCSAENILGWSLEVSCKLKSEQGASQECLDRGNSRC